MGPNMAKFAIFVAAALYQGTASEEARAGHWSSGGGEILEHAQNPWFLEGPSLPRPIRYCVASGPDFPIALGDLESLVASSFRWWNGQFSNAHQPDNQVLIGDRVVNLRVAVNTSHYVKVPCDRDTELSFQFGTLTPDQEAEFKRLQVDLTRYVALTIRTDYSDDLRGKGFIYISPDRGPQAFRGQNIMAEAWTAPDPMQSRSRLQSVLVHELGHVFGLVHADRPNAIMNAHHAEFLVSQDSRYSMGYLLLNGHSVFFPKAGYVTSDCGLLKLTKVFREFFEIPDEMECIHVRLSLNSLIVEMSKTMWDTPKVRVGSARFVDGGQRRHKQLVTLFLPQRQTLFPQIPQIISSLLGPAGSEVQHSAIFRMEGTLKEKSIFVQAGPDYVQIGGVTDHGIVPDLLPVDGYGRVLSGWSSK